VRVFLAPPAHTDGDSFVHFVESDVLHLGDVFRTNMYPIIDQYNGGSFLGMIEAMEVAIEIAGPETKVIPGHGGEVSDLEGMIEVHGMLSSLRDLVQSAIDSGASLEEISAMNLSQEFDERWGGAVLDVHRLVANNRLRITRTALGSRVCKAKAKSHSPRLVRFLLPLSLVYF